MELTPREKDKLLLFAAALVAERRLAHELKLNYPESVTLISAFIMEGVRNGQTVTALMEGERHILRRSQVVEGVSEMIPNIQVETTLPDGSKLVTVHNPIVQGAAMVLGEYQIVEDNIALNQGRKICTIVVENRGDRPIQVGSHHHFYEVNPVLRFNRLATHGFRLDIAAGATVRFEPGQKREVELVRVAGAQRIMDFRSEVMGALETDNE